MFDPSPVRRLVLLCLTMAAAMPAVEADEPSPAAVARWVRELNDPSPAVRTAAIAGLTAAEDAALDAVAAASTDPVLQRAAEAVAILQAWAFPNDEAGASDPADVWQGLADDPTDDATEQPDAGVDPPAPRGTHEVPPPTPLQRAAERQLSDLAVSETHRAAPIARAALSRHRDERHRRAVRAIRAFGGGTLFTEAGFYDDPLARNGWRFQNIRPGGAIGPGNPIGPGGLFPPNGRGPIQAVQPPGPMTDQPASKRLSRVTIGRDWTGGTDGLYHLVQLEQAPSFDLRIEGQPPGVETEAVSRLLARMDNLAISYASPATLGIAGNASTPLRVEQVTPGGSCALAGVQSGDIIRQLGDDPVRSLPHVKGLLMKYQPGQTVPLTIDRRGVTLVLPVTLQDWSKNDQFRPGQGR